jgi:hypothetical protein
MHNFNINYLGKNNGFILLKKSNNLRKIYYLGRKIRLFLYLENPDYLKNALWEQRKIYSNFFGLFYCEKMEYGQKINYMRKIRQEKMRFYKQKSEVRRCRAEKNNICHACKAYSHTFWKK